MNLECSKWLKGTLALKHLTLNVTSTGCCDKQDHDSQVGILERPSDLQKVARDCPEGARGTLVGFCPIVSASADGLAAWRDRRREVYFHLAGGEEGVYTKFTVRENSP